MAVLTNQVKVNGTSQQGGIEIPITLAQDSVPVVASMLIRQYSKPGVAVAREYPANGHDAHKQAGVSRPVEISLPTVYEPIFRVRDYGHGMDFEDLKNVFSKLTESTKRDSNLETGTFGIGSKCALAFVNSFAIYSIKGGVKVGGIVSRVVDGSGFSIKIPEGFPVETDEPEGTIVEVNVKNVGLFNRNAKELYSFARKGVYLVDGRDYGETFSGMKVGPKSYVRKPTGYSVKLPSYIVMGNIPYPVGEPAYKSFVRYVDIGEFNPAPHREALEQGHDFDSKIEAIVEDITKRYAATFAEKSNQLDGKDFSAFIRDNATEIGRWGIQNQLTYRNQPLSGDVDGEYVVISGSNGYLKTASGDPARMSLVDMAQATHVYGYSPREDMPSDSACSKAYAMRNRTRAVVLWYGDDRPQLWGTLLEWPKTKRSSSVKVGDDWKVPTESPHNPSRWEKKYTYGSSNTKIVPADDWKGENDKRTLVYFSTAELDTDYNVYLVQRAFYDDNVFLVIKTANQWAKTKREYPEAMSLKEYGKALADKLVEKNGLIHYWVVGSYTVRSRYENLRLVPEGAELLEQFSVSDSTERSIVRPYYYSEIDGAGKKLLGKLNELFNKYPMLRTSPTTTDKREYIRMIEEKNNG